MSYMGVHSERPFTPCYGCGGAMPCDLPTVLISFTNFVMADVSVITT